MLERAKRNTHKTEIVKDMSVSNINVGSSMLSYGLKIPVQSPYMTLGMGSSPISLDIQRAQIQEYTHRLQLGMRAYPSQVGMNGLPYHSHLANPYLHPYLYKDPRARFIHEEPKPNHSYIGLIAMAILSAKDKKLVLSDIYQWILDNYTYFRTRGPGWRNSIRHNLSLNDCFIKSGRSANGKGHYWAIHPANLEDFQKGDFRRRRAQRRVRKHMGLAVPDDEDSPSPCDSPVNAWNDTDDASEDFSSLDRNSMLGTATHPLPMPSPDKEASVPSFAEKTITHSDEPRRIKRTFDMDSLLAPDAKKAKTSTVISDDAVVTSDVKTESDTELVNDNVDKNSNCDAREKLLNPNTFDEQRDSDERDSVFVDVDDTSLESKKEIDTASSLPLEDRHLLKPETLSGINRSSAFRNPGQYGWGGLTGYLSTYQIMALNAAGQHSLVVPGTSLGHPSAQRWQQTMAQFLMQSRLKDSNEEQN